MTFIRRGRLLERTLVLLGMVASASFALYMFTSTSQATITRQQDKKKPIVSDGASFSEPSGWIRLVPDKTKTKGLFISPESDRRAPKMMIMVDIGKPKEGLEESAAGLARDWQGTVLDEKTSLDGSEALRIRVAKPAQGLRPVEGVLTIKDGRMYMILGGTLPGQSVVDQVEEVRKSWKWSK
jgi:hypothetical protein